MDYFEKITSVPVYMEEQCLPRQFLKVKYITGIGYTKTVLGELVRHTENPSLGLCMVIRTQDSHCKLIDVLIQVKRIRSMERLVKVDTDYDIGI